MQLNEHSTLEQIATRVKEIITTPGGLMGQYAATMGTNDPEEIRRNFLRGESWRYQGALCTFRLHVDGWTVIIGRDFCCGGWRIAARHSRTNERAGTDLFTPDHSKPLEKYLAEFLNSEVPGNE